MLIYVDGGFTIDPNILIIKCFSDIYNADPSYRKQDALSKMMWIHHMYHPHSLFRDYKPEIKSYEIKKAVCSNELLTYWDETTDELVIKASDWYKAHVRKNSLWDAYDSYNIAVYNLSKIISNPESNASEISKARQELDMIPISLKKMKQQAEAADAVMFEKIAGDKKIKMKERLPSNSQRG